MTKRHEPDPPAPSRTASTRQQPGTQQQQVRAFVPLAVDVVIPTALYFVLHALGLTPVYALTMAGLATGVTAAVSSLLRRRLDGVGVLVLVEIVVSIVLLLLSRDPRVLLLKPSVYTFVAACYLYATCLVGRPVVYQAATPLATRGDPVRLRAYTEAWDSSALFRSRERLVTAGFGTALLLEAVLRVVIVLALPPGDVGRALVAGQLPGVALVVAALLLARSQVPALTRVVDQVQERLMRQEDSSDPLAQVDARNTDGSASASTAARPVAGRRS
jgi:hypothetical protein